MNINSKEQEIKIIYKILSFYLSAGWKRNLSDGLDIWEKNLQFLTLTGP